MKRHLLTVALAIVALGGAVASTAKTTVDPSYDYRTNLEVTCEQIPETDCIIGAPAACVLDAQVYDANDPIEGCSQAKGRFVN